MFFLKENKNIKHIAILLITLLYTSSVVAQKEANIWYFGQNAGIDFNDGTPEAITNGKLNTLEGCASIADKSGALLFYTDGITIWNKNHKIMPNGKNLMGGWSSTQSVLIVKKPKSEFIYYVFTVDEKAGTNGLRYSEIDIRLEDGMGDVNTIKNIPITSPTCEKITSIKHKNGRDFWIVTHVYNSNIFHSYLLTSSGLNHSPIVNHIGSHTSKTKVGYLKASLDSKKIAIANYYIHNVEIFDFDNATGFFSNPISLTNLTMSNVYGIEFSPNNRLLYISDLGDVISNIYQYNLSLPTTNDIINSQTIVGSYLGGGGALQLGPDMKIYHAKVNNSFLGVINNPDSIGIPCNYIEEGFSLSGKISMYGLPTFYNSIYEHFPSIEAKNTCLGDTTHFSLSINLVNDSILWNFGDTGSGYSTTSNHVFSKAGNFIVNVAVYHNGDQQFFQDSVHIKPIPKINLGGDTICYKNNITLVSNTKNASYIWQDNSTRRNLEITEPGTYWNKTILDGCVANDTIVIEDCSIEKKQIIVPNVFTPNNDSHNDVFWIKNLEYANWNLKIYDRWGKLIYTSNHYQNDWDGDSLHDGTYYYILKSKEEDFKGWVQIIR